MPMETANSSNQWDRMLTTPANTPEKSHMEKKAKGTPQEHDSSTSTDTLLKAVDALGKRADDRMEDVSKQMQQHSTMPAAIAKSMQLNQTKINTWKNGLNHSQKIMTTLKATC